MRYIIYNNWKKIFLWIFSSRQVLGHILNHLQEDIKIEVIISLYAPHTSIKLTYIFNHCYWPVNHFYYSGRMFIIYNLLSFQGTGLAVNCIWIFLMWLKLLKGSATYFLNIEHFSHCSLYIWASNGNLIENIF